MINKILLAGVSLCLLIFIGCSNETIEQIDNQYNTVPMNLSTNVLPLTRADYMESGSNMLFSWRSGDEVSVVVDGVVGNDNCKLSTASVGKIASFSGTCSNFDGVKNIYAFYPYNLGGYPVSNGANSSIATTTFTLPNPQLHTVGGAISNSLLVGAGSATSTNDAINASCTLKQVMSIVRLNISNAPGKVTGMSLICSESVFPTTAVVKLSDATISNPSSLTNILSMTVADPTSGNSKYVSFGMFPVDLTGKTIHIELTFEGDLVKSITKSGLSFQRNKHYTVAFDATGASPFVKVAGLKWATGNLIADGVNDAKIGSSTDGGLYFQYASLVGWSGGTNGDGTGRNTNTTPSLTQWIVPVGYSGSLTWNTSSLGSVATDIPSAGTGDPCRYYLGELWRLPTSTELGNLISPSGYPSTGPWLSNGDFALNSTTSYLINNVNLLKFSAVGSRKSPNGDLGNVGEIGQYSSSTANLVSNQILMYFNSHNLDITLSSDLYEAHPVRCVRD